MPEFGQATLGYIPLNNIRTNPIALRDVNKQSEQFQELVGSIRAEGVNNPINIRTKPGEDGCDYELVDGLQRFTAASEAGTGVVDRLQNQEGELEKVPRFVDVAGPDGKPQRMGVIPAQIIHLDTAEALISQIVSNAHKLETKPTEYAAALRRFLAYNPAMTEASLAALLNKSPVWIGKQLGLLKLTDGLKVLVNEGKISVASGYILAKMPPEEQELWKDRAQTMTTQEFGPPALERIKQIRDSARQGREAGSEVFVPVSHLRKKPEIELESDNPQVLTSLIRELQVTQGIKPSTSGLIQAAVAGAQLGIKWVLNMDPKSQEQQKARYDERKKKDDETRIRREAEKSDTKAKELTAKAAAAAQAAKDAAAAAAALPPEPQPQPELVEA